MVVSHEPHALAFRKGEGPPMAPRGWKWVTGKRAKDICFVSPDGARIRSKVALSKFLATYPNPPADHEFLWRVEPSDFKNVPLPGVEKKSCTHRNIKNLSKETQKQRTTQNRKSKNIKQDTRFSSFGGSSISGSFGNSFQVNEMELAQVREFVNLTKRAADRDSEIYQKAQEMVATQKQLLSQIQEDLKRAESEMHLANQNAKRSSRAAKIARKRLEVLHLYHRPWSVTKEQVEIQRKFYNSEVSELKRIQTMIGDINCCCEESLPELASLLEIMKQQRQKVEVARRKMEEMVSFCNS